MANNLERLENLVQLAKEPSAEKRRQLLRDVTDLFFENPEKLNEHESEYFSDIISGIAFSMEMDVRRHLAERLSELDSSPQGLINALANDQIEVARPILMKSRVLQNADLIDIVKRLSQEHLLAVSKRQTVSEEVSDCLVERGDDTVLTSLASNQGAELSRDAAKAMVSRSKNNESMHQPLVSRSDLPPDLLNEMFWHVSAALREHIISSVDAVDENKVEEMLVETMVWANPGQSEDTLGKPEKFILRKEKMNQLDAALLVQLIRQGKIPEMIAGLARLIKADLPMARRIVFDKGGEALAVACKAVGIDRTTFSDLIMLLDTGSEKTRQDRGMLLGVYGRITEEAANRTIRFWRTRRQLMKSGSGATSTEQGKSI